MPSGKGSLVKSRDGDVVEIYLDVVMDRYENGESLAELAEEAEVPEEDLRDCLIDAGFLDSSGTYATLEDSDSSEIDPLVLQAAARSIQAGMSLKRAAQECGVSEDALLRCLTLAGLTQIQITSRTASGRFDENEDWVTSVVMRGLTAVVLPLTEVSERYRKGESLYELADELGVSCPTLRRHLENADLLPAREERDTPFDNLVRSLPHGKVVEMYEGGKSVQGIVSVLRDQGHSATRRSVERVLDIHHVIRHGKPGMIPKGARKGFSSTSIRISPIVSEQNPEAETSVRPSGLVEPELDARSKSEIAREKRLAQLPQDEIVRRRKEGDSILTIVADLRRRRYPASTHYVSLVLARHEAANREQEAP